MKARGFIYGSLLLNLFLFAALAYVASRPAPAPSEPIVRIITNEAPRLAPVNAMPSLPPVASPAPSSLDWRSIEAADYHVYIANLRSVACPEETIRDIIIADVCKLFAARRAAINPPKTYRYWESSDQQYERENVARQAQYRELEKERNALIQELLGVDARRELSRLVGTEETFDRSVAFLPVERQAPFKAMLDKYRDLERAIEREADGKLTPAHREQIAAIQAQRQAEIAQFLTPSELHEYDLTNSRLVREIRGNLSGFEPNESEFLAIYELRQKYEQAFGGERARDDAAREQRRLAQKAMEEQLSATLGPDRYAEYKISSDEAYQEVFRVTKRYDLPKEAAVSVYALKQQAEAEKRRLEQLQTLTPQQRQVALAALAEQTKQFASSALGSTAYNYYQRRDGRWIDRLTSVKK